MKRLGRIVAAALVSALALGGAETVTADQGGSPDANACHGRVVSTLARQGITPADPGRKRQTTAADVHRIIEELCAAGVDVNLIVPAVQKVREA